MSVALSVANVRLLYPRQVTMLFLSLAFLRLTHAAPSGDLVTSLPGTHMLPVPPWLSSLFYLFFNSLQSTPSLEIVCNLFLPCALLVSQGHATHRLVLSFFRSLYSDRFRFLYFTQSIA